MTGLYIHVPFCGSRCIYCDFFSTTLLERRQEYVKALCRELAARRTDDMVSTIYLGGGTPSMLSNSQLQEVFDCIFAHYHVVPDAEVTLEANPDDISPTLLHDLPVNRLSMGVQSFCDDRLKFLRRRHTARQAAEAVQTALDMGIGNISIDLIYGLPGQDMDEWCTDVAKALTLGVPHLSAYALSYEDGTALYKMRERGEVVEADDELSRKMYYHLCTEAKKAGFAHYEISNFAQPGCESRHNSSYWTGVPYLGFGPGAHSYDGHHLRRHNPDDIDAWLKDKHDDEHLTQTDLFNEQIFLSLRTARGLDTEALQRRFPRETADIRATIERYIADGQLVSQPPFIRLAHEAIFTCDGIISDLFAQNGK